MAIGVIQRLKEATTALAGLMSANDKAKLEGIENGATNTPTPVDDLYSESATAPLSANQGRVLRGMFEGSGISAKEYTLSITSDESTYTMTARKYGRIVVLSCSTGGAISTALSANQLLTTLDATYRPVGGLWFIGYLVYTSASIPMSVESNGAVRVQHNVATGGYLRFSVCYISQA